MRSYARIGQKKRPVVGTTGQFFACPFGQVASFESGFIKRDYRDDKDDRKRLNLPD